MKLEIVKETVAEKNGKAIIKENEPEMTIAHERQKSQGKSTEEIRKMFTHDLGEDSEIVEEIIAQLERV